MHLKPICLSHFSIHLFIGMYDKYGKSVTKQATILQICIFIVVFYFEGFKSGSVVFC